LELGPDVQFERRVVREPTFERAYFEQVMAPAFEQYGAQAERFADVVIDAAREFEIVWQEFRGSLDIAE
jgi:hypothetical protein